MTCEPAKTVLPFPGNSVPLVNGEPNPKVVEMLERFLADAKSGVLVACAVCGVLAQTRFTSSEWKTDHNYCNDLAAAVMMLNARFGQSLIPDDDA